jgi:hypothetical protein
MSSHRQTVHHKTYVHLRGKESGPLQWEVQKKIKFDLTVKNFIFLVFANIRFRIFYFSTPCKISSED